MVDFKVEEDGRGRLQGRRGWAWSASRE